MDERRRDQISSNYKYIRQYASRLRVMHHQASGAGTDARDACPVAGIERRVPTPNVCTDFCTQDSPDTSAKLRHPQPTGNPATDTGSGSSASPAQGVKQTANGQVDGRRANLG